MRGSWLRFAVLAVLAACAAGAAQPEPEGKLILGTSSMWRYHYTLMPAVIRTDAGVEKVDRGTEAGAWLDFPTPLPPGDWMAFGFDDVGWHRKMMIDPDSPFVAHLAIRGKFAVTDPARADGLKLRVGYRGGVAVYVNGTEIARGHLRAGAAPDDLAEDYPPDEPEQVRELVDVRIPPEVLRPGPNVLAFEVHRSVQPPAQVKPANGFTEITAGTCGITAISLIAPEGAAVLPNVIRPPGLQVWNSGPMQSDYECDYGDPNEALKPIRIVAPRGGAGSGKVVVGSKEPIKGLRAAASGLARQDGAGAIPGSAVQVRYALPTVHGPAYVFPGQGSAFRCEALDETPPAEAEVRIANILPTWTERVALSGAVVAVWVTVEVPPEAAAGRYAGTLTVTLPGGAPVSVPVELQVCPWRVPEPSQYHVFVDVVQSPESVALRYDVPLWSDEHFALMARSLKLLGQIGNKVCYIPLICDTNHGNDESMVRWIKQPDGTYAHDFSIVDRYLDLVTEYQGRPSVVCVYVWDTYLEGGLSGRHPGGEEIVQVRQEQMLNGPLVSTMDEAGNVVKEALPRYSDAQSRALWEPMLKELHRRLEARGLADAMMWGYATDHLPAPEVVAHFQAILPQVLWVCCAHDAFKTMQIKHVPVGLAIGPYAWRTALFGVDPSLRRMHGWRGENLVCHFPRRLWDRFCPTTYRFIGEMNATGMRRGFARLGGDFFAVGTDKRGRRRGTLQGRFPKTSWRQLNILTSLLEPGQEGPVATARFEMLREGLQECEARVFIQEALLDEGQRTLLGEELAVRVQKLLDERTRNVFRAVSTLWAKAGSAARCCYSGTSWWNWPPIIGSHWFASSDWQAWTARLYEAAAEVEARLQAARAPSAPDG